MSKRERIRLFVGVAVMVLFFCAIASIGWTKTEFTVTYFYGYDGKYETVTVNKGYIKEPLEPGRYGYVFDGWYYTDKQGNEIYFDHESERVTTNMELTAHWVPYETTFRLAYRFAGEYEVIYVPVKYGEEYTLPTPEIEGYYFHGWQSLYGNKIYSSGVWTAPVVEMPLSGRFSKFKPGTTYFLGEYEQDTYEYNGKEPIEWIPIDKKDGKYLLVSKYSLDAKSLHKADKALPYIPWADCDLRKWLNTEFYDTVFTDEEKLLIQDSYDAELGTTDKVFLLSRDEAKLLIGFDEYGAGTPYALAAGLKETAAMADEYSLWFTRSCDEGRNWASSGGDTAGGSAPIQILGLRPAIWVSAEIINNQD